MQGWRLFGGLASALTLLFALTFVSAGSDEAGLRVLVRVTVRASFAIFLVVYSASSLRRLWPTPTSRWLLRNRRTLGVSFAWAHGLHALAIGMLVVLLGDAFEANSLTLAFLCLGYLLVLAMALTSNDRAVRRLGPRRWGQLHRAGIHTLWLIFTVQWTSLALSSPGYLPAAALVWGAGGLRLVAWRARRSARSSPAPASASDAAS